MRATILCVQGGERISKTPAAALRASVGMIPLASLLFQIPNLTDQVGERVVARELRRFRLDEQRLAIFRVLQNHRRSLAGTGPNQ
jgi:hypothetical protein